MCKIIDGLPLSLNLDDLRPKKQLSPWTRDQTVISPDGQFFAVAFNIEEVTMMNEMGGVAWGGFYNGTPKIAGHLAAWSIHCWSRPFCEWVTPNIFVVKLAEQKRHWPLLAIDMERGFQIVGKGGLETRPSDILSQDIPQNGWSSIAPIERN
ncbi:hypothetical protein [Thioclava sp.]|uniref:hypothetical protein n=1 Tax=Thioclava sp. TaxID=1933450 RepID=UPI003AA8D29D